MPLQQPDTEELLARAERGDPAARDRLLARHRDRLRKMVAWRLDGRLVTSATGPGQRLEREELRRRVQKALQRLPERDREVLVLRNLEQLPVADAAKVLGISPGAVKTRHVRALERLQALLDEGMRGEASHD